MMVAPSSGKSTLFDVKIQRRCHVFLRFRWREAILKMLIGPIYIGLTLRPRFYFKDRQQEQSVLRANYNYPLYAY